MPPIFQEYKKLIDTFLRTFLTEKELSLGEMGSLGSDVVDRFLNIVTRGKTIRGSLVLLAYCFNHDEPSEDAVKLAATIELIQTALVIHDDIMDHDDQRRGIAALHTQYNSEFLAMCAGDILFFMAFELVGTITTDALTLGRIVRLFGREYQSVGVAQMMDVAKTAKTKLEIFNLYTYKTARYTFAVPLMLGATLAGTTKEMLRYLESYGVATGILFQIQDDRLDREANPFTARDIHAYNEAANESLDRLPIHKQQKKVLQDLLHFVVTRKT
jgi:geranylgeranyl diphosphate synthase type I